MKELVSIIVPVHNTSEYLKDCIDSLLTQTYKYIEIIAIENGSEDNSLEILNKYQDKIRIEILKEASLSLARNKGIELSTGKYITFVDSDDKIERTYVEELKKSLEESKSDLSICNIKEIHLEKNKVVKREDYPHNNILKEEIENNLDKFSYGPTAKLFKKEIIIENNIFFPLNLKYEDIPFVLKYLLNTSKISKVNKHLYNYFIHTKSEQTTIDKKIFDIIEILNICSNFTDLNSFKDLYIKTITTFALKTRNIKENKLRNSFIDIAYEELNKKYPNWRNCEYMKNRNLAKKIIQQNKKLVKIYTNIYSKID